MKKMAIRSILLTSFAIMSALSLFIGGISIYSTNIMSKRELDMYDYTPVVNTLGTILEHFQKINSDLYHLSIHCEYEDTVEIDTYNDHIDYCIAKIQTAINDYIETAFDETVEKNFYEAKFVYENEYLPFIKKVQAVLPEIDIRTAHDIIFGGKDLYEKTEGLFNASVDDNIAWNYADTQANKDVARFALVIQTGAIAASLMAALSFAYYFSKRIGKMSNTIEQQAAHIQNENERLKLLLDTTPLACRLMKRISAGKYELFECNEESIKFFNFKSKQEAMERYFDTYPDYQPDGSNSIEKGMSFLEKAYVEGSFTADFCFQTTDGVLIPTEVTLVRVKYGNEHVIAGYTRDLREHKRMMADIEKRDNLLNVMNRVAVVLLAAENEENFEKTLVKGMELIGKSLEADRVQIWPNEMRGDTLHYVLMYEWLSEAGREAPPTAIGTAVPYSAEWEALFLRGECINGPTVEMPQADQELWSSLGITSTITIPLFYQEKFWGIFCVDDCIKERYYTESEIGILHSAGLMLVNAINRNLQAVELEAALEETQKANDAKSDFLANMSHEMRTPLNAIIGLSGLSLESSGLDEKTSSYLEIIYRSGEMLLTIVNDILDISKIEAGRMDLVEIDYDVPSLVNDTVTQNVMRIGEKPIELKLDITEDMFSRLHGDELRVKQIINNLLSNAIKYTEEGAVELSIRCEREKDRVWVTAKVSDTGKGIRPEDIGNLFKDYTQLDLKSNRAVEGTGLGLPIAKKLAEMMNGTIDVESDYGKGSVFTVRIAQKFISDVYIDSAVVNSLKSFRYSADKRGQNTQFNRISLPYARVLVVDDNPTNLEVSKGLMKPYGMHIDCVSGGQQAIDAIRSEKVRYNAVFMDHMMPGIDGIEATRIIREEIGTEYAKNVPIIALTANAISGNDTMFMSKGFQAFISKPVEIARLDEVIRYWVRDKEQEKKILTDTNGEVNPQQPIFVNENIPALDIPGGIKYFGGNEKIYMDTLCSYADNTGSLLEQLKTVNEETLTDYAIVVHGIKGSSRGICAFTAGDMAEKLEKAAKAGNYAFVEENNKDFIGHVEDLINNISILLAKTAAGCIKPGKDKPDMNLLRKLFAACDDFAADEVEALITELDAYEYGSDGDLVAELVRTANQYNFIGVKEKLATLFAE